MVKKLVINQLAINQLIIRPQIYSPITPHPLREGSGWQNRAATRTGRRNLLDKGGREKIRKMDHTISKQGRFCPDLGQKSPF